MAKIETKLKDSTEEFMRFEVFVNHKKQIGCILGFLNKDTSQGKFSTWKVENDPFNNKYSNSDEAVEALCAKNGRKLKTKSKLG